MSGGANRVQGNGERKAHACVSVCARGQFWSEVWKHLLIYMNVLKLFTGIVHMSIDAFHY